MNSVHAWIISFGPYRSTVQNIRSEPSYYNSMPIAWVDVYQGNPSNPPNNKKEQSCIETAWIMYSEKKYWSSKKTGRSHLGKFGKSSSSKNCHSGRRDLLAARSQEGNNIHIIQINRHKVRPSCCSSSNFCTSSSRDFNRLRTVQRQKK